MVGFDTQGQEQTAIEMNLKEIHIAPTGTKLQTTVHS
jgi:hypothetical protein